MADKKLKKWEFYRNRKVCLVYTPTSIENNYNVCYYDKIKNGEINILNKISRKKLKLLEFMQLICNPFADRIPFVYVLQ